MPIGFYTEAQRASLKHGEGNAPPEVEKHSVQGCTDVYREEIDRYTVLHEYTKGGRTYQTPYTRNQVISRINQYKREVEQALQRQMGRDILENRRRWLTYWQGKLEELQTRQKAN